MAAVKSRRSAATRKPKPDARAADPLVGALAEAAWSEADRALAEALVCADELEGARGPRRRQLFDLLGQALNRAARRRGLSRVGQLGAEEIYDPERHEPLPSGVGPGPVAIVARGVVRGREVVLKPRVRRSR